MRKLLLTILLIVLIILSGYMLFAKLEIGNIEILGIKTLMNENDKLDSAIATTTQVATIQYDSALKTLETASQGLLKQKEEYDNYIINSSNNGAINKQIQSYELEYLWIKIGNYAADEGVTLKMDVAVNNATLGTYNLNFSAIGTYIQITEFIYDLDNDSSLLFKIEDFELKPNNSESNLIATFVCKDISININSEDIVSSSNEQDKNTSELETQNSDK